MTFTADESELPAVEEVTEAHDSLESYTLAGTYTAKADNRSLVQLENEQTARPGSGETYERITNERGDQTVRVSNGTVEWTYTTSDNTVTRQTVEDNSSLDPSLNPGREFVTELIARLNNDTTATGSTQVLPLFVIGDPGDGQQEAATVSPGDSNVSFTITYEGTQSVADRDAHVIQMTGTDTRRNVTRELDQQVYIDTEWFIPLGYNAEIQTAEQSSQVTYQVENVSFNQPVEDELFEFTPPTNATVGDPSTEIEHFEIKTELTEAVANPPTAEVPSRFSFNNVIQNSETATVTIAYSDDTDRLIVTRTVSPDDPAQLRGDPVSLESQAGYYTDSEISEVRWTREDRWYRVQATGEIDREELIAVARSVAQSSAT
jgi:hypothetical protein